MSLYENHIGINITSSKLQLVEVNYKDEKFYLENVDEEFFDDFLNLQDKETKCISILQKAFDEILLRKSINSSAVSITLPQEFFHIVELPYEESLIENDQLESFRWDISVLYPELKTDDLLIQKIEVDKSSLRKEKKAIVISVSRRYLKILHKFIVRNNLNLKYIDNAHIAVNNFVSLEELGDKGLVMSVYIGEKSLSVLVVENNYPVFFSSKKISSISSVIPSIFKEVEKMKLSGIDLNNITQSLIAGDDLSENLIKQVQESFELPMLRLNPFNKLDVNPSLKENSLYIEKFNSFSAAMGIALRLI